MEDKGRSEPKPKSMLERITGSRLLKGLGIAAIVGSQVGSVDARAADVNQKAKEALRGNSGDKNTLVTESPINSSPINQMEVDVRVTPAPLDFKGGDPEGPAENNLVSVLEPFKALKNTEFPETSKTLKATPVPINNKEAALQQETEYLTSVPQILLTDWQTDVMRKTYQIDTFEFFTKSENVEVPDAWMATNNGKNYIALKNFMLVEADSEFGKVIAKEVPYMQKATAQGAKLNVEVVTRVGSDGFHSFPIVRVLMPEGKKVELPGWEKDKVFRVGDQGLFFVIDDKLNILDPIKFKGVSKIKTGVSAITSTVKGFIKRFSLDGKQIDANLGDWGVFQVDEQDLPLVALSANTAILFADPEKGRTDTQDVPPTPLAPEAKGKINPGGSGSTENKPVPNEIAATAPKFLLSVDSEGTVVKENETVTVVQAPSGEIIGINENGEIVLKRFANSEKYNDWFKKELSTDKFIPVNVYMSVALTSTDNVTKTLKDVKKRIPAVKTLGQVDTAVTIKFHDTKDNSLRNGWSDNWKPDLHPIYNGTAPKTGEDILNASLQFAISKASQDGGKTVKLADGSIWTVKNGVDLVVKRTLSDAQINKMVVENAFTKGHWPPTIYVDQQTGKLVIESLYFNVTGINISGDWKDAMSIIMAPYDNGKIILKQELLGPEITQYDMEFLTICFPADGKGSFSWLFDAATSTNKEITGPGSNITFVTPK